MGISNSLPCPVELRQNAQGREVSVPLEFQREAEQAVAAGPANCLMVTFLALAGRARLGVRCCRVKAGAARRKTDLSSIVLKPEIGVAAEDLERARKVFGEALKYCFLNSSVWEAVRVEPHLFVVPIEVAA